MQSDWRRAFWIIPHQQEFHQIWSFQWKPNNNNPIFHSRTFLVKTNYKMFPKNRKDPVLRPFLTLFGHFPRMKIFPKKRTVTLSQAMDL